MTIHGSFLRRVGNTSRTNGHEIKPLSLMFQPPSHGLSNGFEVAHSKYIYVHVPASRVFTSRKHAIAQLSYEHRNFHVVFETFTLI